MVCLNFTSIIFLKQPDERRRSEVGMSTQIQIHYFCMFVCTKYRYTYTQLYLHLPSFTATTAVALQMEAKWWKNEPNAGSQLKWG